MTYQAETLSHFFLQPCSKQFLSSKYLTSYAPVEARNAHRFPCSIHLCCCQVLTKIALSLQMLPESRNMNNHAYPISVSWAVTRGRRGWRKDWKNGEAIRRIFAYLLFYLTKKWHRNFSFLQDRRIEAGPTWVLKKFSDEFDKSDLITQFENIPHMESPYQQRCL